jgi:hypothetical protein
MFLMLSETRHRRNKLISVDPQYDDDGIGTSDDETNSNSSTATKSCDDPEADEAEAKQPFEVETADPAAEAECDDAAKAKLKSRRVIKPDMSALNRLLTFDEVRPATVLQKTHS